MSSMLTSSGQEQAPNIELVTYIFPDFGAVEYFQREFASTGEFHVVEESEALGFEIYLVDQWVRHRKIGTVISVFTGNYESRVKVVRFTIKRMPTKKYPARFQEYLNETIQNHASYKRMSVPETSTELFSQSTSEPAEYLFVTNITALPSNVNLVPIRGGDSRAIKATFVINSNLKKLNCAGRTLSLLTETVSAASEDKFRQMYHVYNELVPIRFAVRELVNLIQTSLFYFDLLDARYCDGLLCQKTEDAINNWWNLIGLPHFNAKPHPRTGILPAKTVASIISLTLSVKMRLHLFGGCDVPKDPYDFENFMLSIGHFQKQVKLEKKRKLNLITLLRLFYYTNQKLPSTSKLQFNAFGSELSLQEGSQVDLSSNFASTKNTAASQHPSRSISTQTASAYRRNKLHYSKELKKLTNAVKNTVQDHIIVREDNDGFYPEQSNKAGAKLRSKIASKLSDLVTPNDVETTDLDILVKRCLLGKTLIRLWQGLAPSTDVTTLTLDDKLSLVSLHQLHNHHHPYLHKRNGSHDPSGWTAGDSEDSKYQFICLRDGIIMNREQWSLHNLEKGSGRLGRMRFALQGRRPNPIRELDMVNIEAHEQKGKMTCDSEDPDFMMLRLDQDNEKATCVDFAKQQPCKGTGRSEDFSSMLRRRNSYPLLQNGVELNLRTAEAVEPANKPLESYALRKCASFSMVEDFYCGDYELETDVKLRDRYIDSLLSVIKLERSRKDLESGEAMEVAKSYKRLNIELVKVHSVHSRMLNKQLVVKSEYSLVLTSRMKDLTENIDRMNFRSRDLLKKINELEENSNNFNFKLQEACLRRLDDLVNSLVHSNKFKDVFKDRDERRKIILSLGGQESDLDDEADSDKTYWGLRPLVIIGYELMLFFLQLLHFDRSKMNLDRIRHSYSKVDPSRKYIDSAYTFVRRDSIARNNCSTTNDSLTANEDAQVSPSSKFENGDNN